MNWFKVHKMSTAYYTKNTVISGIRLEVTVCKDAHGTAIFVIEPSLFGSRHSPGVSHNTRTKGPISLTRSCGVGPCANREVTRLKGENRATCKLLRVTHRRMAPAQKPL